MGFFKEKSYDQESDTEYRDLMIAYKKVFGSPDGKKVLYDLMNKYHVLNTHQGMNSEFSEGQRSVVLDIMKYHGISIEQLDAMLKGDDE